MRFRSSPHVDLMQLGDLAPERREHFLELERDPDFYGLFAARAPLAMNLKAVNRSTAELFRELATPAPLDADEDMIDLVLDGILEVESGDGFVCGADALPLLAPIADAAPASRLAHDALLHAQDLETSDPQSLTTALYLYNRIPITPFWRARFADAEAVLAYVGADRAPLRPLLEQRWTASRGLAGWLGWFSPSRAPRGEHDVTYKLYVSPRPERIAETFAIVTRVLADFPEASFKLGNGVIGLLRPDKLVAYFASREEMLAAAESLRRELAGCDAHGVPFTAALDEGGLLSWGVDPPGSEVALRWLGRTSWRLWLVNRLGSALAIAKCARTASAVEPWRFAIERARRHGVDVDTWTPSATLWSNG
ncbi:MAG TPA: hypothetical protein VND45_15275 [Thermoanaerobaculia bacterium]|jgi:hypothetical protein|nr:hypothetical protein [Thermoanaerobaculia bacterium]